MKKYRVKFGNEERIFKSKKAEQRALANIELERNYLYTKNRGKYKIAHVEFEKWA